MSRIKQVIRSKIHGRHVPTPVGFTLQELAKGLHNVGVHKSTYGDKNFPHSNRKIDYKE